MRLKMVTNTTGTSTNMSSVPAKTVKKIVKKEVEAITASVPAPVSAAVKEVKAKKEKVVVAPPTAFLLPFACRRSSAAS